MPLVEKEPRIELNLVDQKTPRFCLRSTKLLDISLLALEGKRHDTTDVHLRSVYVHVEAEFFTDSLDVLETLLVVGTGTAHPDLDLVFVQNGGNLSKGANDTLESGSDVGEIGNTTTDKEDLAVGVDGRAQHQVENGAGVVESLSLSGSTGVFTVVGELANETSGSNGVCVDDGGTTTSDESPHTAVGVQDSELKRGTSLGIHVRDELLLLAQFTSERSGELHGRPGINVDLVGCGKSSQAKVSRATGNSPLGTALELSSLVKLGSQVKEVDFGRSSIGVGNDNERVDLKVGELAVNVNSVETRNKVNQDVVNALGDFAEKCGSDFLVGGVVLEVDGDQKLLCFSINVTNIDTTLVGEEDPVTLRKVRP